MFRRCVYIAAIFLFSFEANSQIAPPALVLKSREIRVLLGSYRRFSVSGNDLLIQSGVDSNKSAQMQGSSIFSIRCGHDANGPFIDFGAEKKSTATLDIYAPSGFLQVNGKLYRNKITILADNDTCAVINTVELDKYLAGLLNKEMIPSWPIEALKAQAVASRSYALYQMNENRNRAFDIESTTQDQVYEGADSETPKSSIAVESTSGMVLSFGEGPAKAYFHANCGGQTEIPEAVWGANSGAFRSVVCPYHKNKRDQQRWSLKLTKPQLEHALRKIAGLLPKGFYRIARLEAGAPNTSGRMNDVLVSDVAGDNLVLSATQLRAAIGYTKLKSTSFHIENEGNSYKIIGEGYGHGVGMCQVGARAMAEQGKKFLEILRYYYPLAKIARL